MCNHTAHAGKWEEGRERLRENNILIETATPMLGIVIEQSKGEELEGSPIYITAMCLCWLLRFLRFLKFLHCIRF